jgi:hypothetical protein
MHILQELAVYPGGDAQDICVLAPIRRRSVVGDRKSDNSTLFSASQTSYDHSGFMPATRSKGETMKRVLAVALLLGMSCAFTLKPAQTQKPEVAKVSLKVGDVAPDFSLLSDQWKTVKLSDYKGKKNVLLAIYVLAFTGG